MATLRFHLNESNPEDAELFDWLNGMGYRKIKFFRASMKFMKANYPVCDYDNVDHVIYMIEQGYFPTQSGHAGSSASSPLTNSTKPKRTRKTTKKSTSPERSPAPMPENRPQFIVPSETSEAAEPEKPKEAAPPEVTVPKIPKEQMTVEQRRAWTQELLRRSQWSGNGTWDDDFDEQ